MSNPVISEKMYSDARIFENNETMTLQGTVNKSLFLIILTILSAVGVWSYSSLFFPYLIPLVIGNLVLAMVIIFFKKTSPYLSLFYAILEGIVLGVLSAYFEAAFPGIVIQAVSLTFGVFVIMLLLFKFKIIQVTEKFRTSVIVCTGAIALVYLIEIVLGFFGINVPYIHESGLIGIGISLFIVGIASFNLLLDFDNIETGVKLKAPKYMEWYTSFGLLITLIWLYLEILNLLSKMRD